MQFNSRPLLHTFALLGMLAGGQAASAAIIDANSFAVGTDVSNAVPGVTLAYASHALGQSATFSTAPLVIGSATSEIGTPPLTFNTFGPGENGNDYSNPFATTSLWNDVEAVFATPVTSVTVNSFSDSGDFLNLFAFDTHGNLIGQSQSAQACIPRPGFAGNCLGFSQTATFNSSTPIGSILAGSFSATDHVTEISTVPLPPSFVLLGSGALAIGMIVLRRRRESFDSTAMHA